MSTRKTSKDSVIALINPPSPFLSEAGMNPHIGLSMLIGSLKREGYNFIRAIDYGAEKWDYDKDFWLTTLPEADFWLIGGVTAQFKWTKKIVQFIQKHRKGKIIVGGPHATSTPKDFVRLGVDCVIMGDGEMAVIDAIQGREGIIVDTYFDEKLIPDRSLFGMKRYKRTVAGKKAAHIITIKGCPYNCQFCDKISVGRRVRYRDFDAVKAEVAGLWLHYAVEALVIYDDTFFLREDRLIDFCDYFKKNGIIWRAWARADTISSDTLGLAKESGLTSITIGIESGSDTILKSINKQITAKQNEYALMTCKEVGVPVRCSLMYANPGESIGTLKETVEMVRRTQPDEWNLSVLHPVPGSVFWCNPQKYGISFDREAIIKSDYEHMNRYGDTGLGDIWHEIDTMPKKDMKRNLKWFVEELEKASPRRNIQDTIQEVAA